MAVVDSADAGAWALRQGATIIQLRIPGAPGRWLEKEARALIPTSHVPVVIGSRCDVALAVGAYGVHLPETDIPVADARRLLGGDRLIGRSVHSLEFARTAAEAGADYLVFGPVYETASHPGHAPVGLDALREVCAAVRVPVLAIGGVRGARIQECAQAGAAGYAAISAFAPPP
jgi:thiamine-phosphate diphosphorylase